MPGAVSGGTASFSFAAGSGATSTRAGAPGPVTGLLAGAEVAGPADEQALRTATPKSATTSPDLIIPEEEVTPGTGTFLPANKELDLTWRPALTTF